MKSEKLPNFLIVGAAKCGTTSLGEYLNQHKKIFISNPKEPKFFSFSYVKNGYKGAGDNYTKEKAISNLEDYRKLFIKAKEDQILGEASVDNLYYHDKVIPKIKEVLGDPKIIIMLRDPKKRAFSAYAHLLRDNREQLSFKEGLRVEKERLDKGYEFIWAYKKASLYSDSVEAYMNSFSNVKIIIFEEFIKDQEKYSKEVLTFLGVKNNDFSIEETHQNISGKPKLQFLNDLFIKDSFIKTISKKVVSENKRAKIKEFIQKKNLNPIEKDFETINALQTVFNEDICRLEKILDKDLSIWTN